MSESWSAISSHLLDLDRLKLVQRRTYIDGGRRLENSAEHSWHVALAAIAVAQQLGWSVSTDRLLQLALVHDLGEMDAGDTFLYSGNREEGSRRERAAVAALARKYDGLIPDLESLWEEQELGITDEARVLKIADRLLPFLHNIASNGKTWKQHGIAKSQVLAMHAFIAKDAPELFAWMGEQIDQAAEKGWLLDR